MATIPAIYFDGRRSHATHVTVWREDGVLHWCTTDRTQAWQAVFDSVRPSARVTGLPFTLRLDDGAQLQIAHDDLPADWFAQHHRLERLVDWLERRWPAALASIVIVVFSLVALIEFGLPWAADRVALHLPHTVESALGRQSLRALEGRWLKPSRLAADKQAHYQALFARFTHGLHDLPEVRLRFYRSPAIGANAFALPDGTVVFTDELANVLPDDDGFVAVIAHELGHQAHHHMMREVVRSSGVFIVAGLLMGDVTSVGGLSAGVPMFLLDAHYSRSFEEDADHYAFDALSAAGIDPIAFVHVMQALEKTLPVWARNTEGEDKSMRYVSSHPLTTERIRQAEAASRVFRASHPAAPRP